jgi:hypothetical protein
MADVASVKPAVDGTTTGETAGGFELPDRSVGNPSASNPLESWSWQDLRDEIYAETTRLVTKSPFDE